MLLEKALKPSSAWWLSGLKSIMLLHPGINLVLSVSAFSMTIGKPCGALSDRGRGQLAVLRGQERKGGASRSLRAEA